MEFFTDLNHGLANHGSTSRKSNHGFANHGPTSRTRLWTFRGGHWGLRKADDRHMAVSQGHRAHATTDGLRHDVRCSDECLVFFTPGDII